MSRSPYISSDDSALLRRALEGRTGEACLELGAGNGGALAALSRGYRVAVGTDLAFPDMRDWSEGADFVLADRASCFRDGSFDLVAFNPPYVGGEGTGDIAVDGGEGLEVPKSFLKEALRTVKDDGAVVFLLNQEAELPEFEEICRARRFRMRRLVSERAFFETLSVYEAESEEPASQAVVGVGHLDSTASRLHLVPASPS
jgi:release factor glutamine methyltransferase